MNPAIFYHPEAYTTNSPKLMGRNVAGQSFLKGFLTHSKSSEFWAQVQSSQHAQDFSNQVISAGRNEPVHIVDKFSLGLLSKPGVIFLPGPGIGIHSFHRSTHGSRSWSLCGITHTTSSANAMDAIVDLISSPVQPWDALICTSNSVKKNVEHILQEQVNYLKDRLGVTKIVLPQLPVIPLGIHTSDFEFDSVQKVKAREKLDVSSNTIVVLFMGRLSFHAKAHPLAMYQALEKAVQSTGKEVLLVECGWHANEHIAKAYQQAALEICPSIRVVSLDGRIVKNRETAWAAADIFCSLSDNIQETFGIVPLEAMASGLPVVVSDWDGYKDTVRDGVDGFRIPTLMPSAGLGNDLAYRHAMELDTYDMYCGYTSSLVSVNIQAAARAFVSLFESKELREKMGQAGRKHTKECYDWKEIIPRYELLWRKLNDLRLDKSLVSYSDAWPARLDPFHTFDSYPTKTLSKDVSLSLVDSSVESALSRIRIYLNLQMVNYAKFIIPNENEIISVLQAASNGAKTPHSLIAEVPSERRAFVLRSLVWLVKIGILEELN